MKKKDIKPYELAQASAKFLNESYDEDKWYDDNPTTDAVNDAWAKMVAEINSKLNFKQVVAAAAKKYFPGAAPKIATWIEAKVGLICKDGYPEDWRDFENCAENFGDAHKITPTEMAKMMAKDIA